MVRGMANSLARWAARSVLASVLAAASVAAVPAVAGAAAPAGVRLMPKYDANKGDAVTDSVRVSSERKQFQAAYEQFRTAAQEYQKEVKDYIAREVQSRQKTVAAGYQSQIDKLDQEQFDLRREAIARLETFIFRHRDHDKYTPDALFRLAELYYEDTIAGYNRSSDNFTREMDLYNRGKILDMPQEARRDFSRSIAIYKYLHWVPDGTPMEPLSGKLSGLVLEKRWPNHTISDAAMYLQGFCEYEMRESDPRFEQKSVVTLSALEDHYPKSKYVAEAWLRVGEIHFDDNDYEKAAAAYERAALKAKEFGDNANYSLALYKLGWSNFQLYRYSEAVKWFQQLIEFEDEIAAAAEKLSKEAKEAKAKKKGFDLRKEAIEYLAKSLAEPSWDDDSCDDFGSDTTKGECAIVDPRVRPILYTASVLEPKLDPAMQGWAAPFKGEVLANMNKNLQARNDVRKSLINGKPYVYDILKMYGETLFNQREDDYYWQAIRVMGYVVANWPMSRDAQEMERKIIQSLDILARAGESYQIELAKDPKSVGAKIGLELAHYAADQQIVERQRYMKMFGKGTEWYAKWGSDKDLSAQVDEATRRIRFEFALLNHAEAQKLKAAGDFEKAFVKYGEAGLAYEELLKADPESPDAYRIAWTLAECWYWAGVQCTAPRDKDGNIIEFEGEVAPTAPDRLDAVKKSCSNMEKSIAYYNMVRDWKGPRTRDDKGAPMDFTEPAAYSAIDSSERVLGAKASYPKTDPERIDPMSLPTIRPTAKQDDDDIKAVEGEKEVKRATRRKIDPLAVEWILAADGYVALSEKYPSKDDEGRPWKLALKAAELLYKNRHFDPWPEGVTPRTPAEFWSARLRFRAMLGKFPGTVAAAESVKNMLTTFAIERDMAALESFTEEIEKKGWLSKEQTGKLKTQIKDFKLGQLADKAYASFTDAENSAKAAAGMANPDEAGKALETARLKYDQAGDEFKKLRNDTDKVETKRQALLAAVRSYYRGEQWDKCIETLTLAEQMLRDWKPKDAKEKDEIGKGLEEVLEIRADLNFKFFKINETIQDFVLLYQNAPNGPKAEYYLKTAAQMAFFNSNWDKAVDLNQQIIARFEKSGDLKKQQVVKDALWQIQTIYKAAGNINKQIESLEAYILRYQAEKASSGKVFRAYGMIAEIYETRGDKTSATKMYQRIIDAFAKGGYEKNGGAEATAAAMSVFTLMKPRFDTFMAGKLVENPKLPVAKRMPDLQSQVKKMMDVLLGPEIKVKTAAGEGMVRCGDCGGSAECRTLACKEDPKQNGLYEEYLSAVAFYGSQNWSYAAMLYRARLLKQFARTIYAAPRPADMSDEEVEAYEAFLEQLGAKFENRAIKSLEAALQDAEGKGVVNNWVTELRSEMNKYKPKDYPLLRDEKRLEVSPAGTLPQPDNKELR
jgi:hypothetical protein